MESSSACHVQLSRKARELPGLFYKSLNGLIISKTSLDKGSSEKKFCWRALRIVRSLNAGDIVLGWEENCAGTYKYTFCYISLCNEQKASAANSQWSLLGDYKMRPILKEVCC